MNKNFIKGLVISVVVSGSAFAQSAVSVLSDPTIVKPINICAAVQAQLAQCTNDKAAMQIELDNSEANYQSVLITLAGTQTALDSCTASLLEGDGQAVALMTQLQGLEIEKAALQQQVDGLVSQKATLELENAEMEALIVDVEKRLKGLSKAATNTKKKIGNDFGVSKKAAKTLKKFLKIKASLSN